MLFNDNFIFFLLCIYYAPKIIYEYIIKMPIFHRFCYCPVYKNYILPHFGINLQNKESNYYSEYDIIEIPKKYDTYKTMYKNIYENMVFEYEKNFKYTYVLLKELFYYKNKCEEYEKIINEYNNKN